MFYPLSVKDITEIHGLVRGFWTSRIILTANNLGLFDHLDKPVSARGLARRLRLDERALEILLDALSGLGLIRKSKGFYRNSRTASRHLVRGKKHYQGDILRHQDQLWKRWSDLDGILQTGRPSEKGKDHESFIRGMHNLASEKAKGLVSLIGPAPNDRILDLGGGPGTYSIEFAKRGCLVTLFDLPQTIDIAREYIGENHPSVTLVEGDFLKDPIGKGYDIVFASNILHIFSSRENQKLIKKIRRSLLTGGRLIINDFLLHEKRTSPPSGAIFSVNMLVNTPSGRVYTTKEMTGWCRQAGFRRVRTTRVDESVLIQAEK
jgi:2-polyprenyl-3-methyl-5-hydroxy-6-metoxy-1,4-benzoquinol methylase